MIKGYVRLLLLVCLLVQVGNVASGADDATVNFNFDQVNIRSFVKLVGDVTGKRFVVSDEVEAKITVVAPRVKHSEVFPLFVSILESCGCTVVQDGDLYRVVKLGGRRIASAPVVGPDGTLDPESGLVTKVFHLVHVSAAEIAKLLEGIVSGAGSGGVGSVEETNHLIVTDTAASIRRIEAIIKEVDRPGLARMTEIVQLQHIGAEELAARIGAAMDEGESRGEKLKRRLPAVSGPGGSDGRSATVIASPHANQLILGGTAAQIAEMRRIVGLMDVEAPPGRGRLNAIFLKYISAEDAAKNLNSLLNQPQGKVEEAGPKRGTIAIQASPANNALLVDSSAADFDVVLRLIEQIDLEPKQVHISVLIGEVSARNQFDLGVEMAAVDLPGSVGDTVLQGGSLFNDGSDSLMSAVQSGLFPRGMTIGVGRGSYTDDNGDVVVGYPGIINIEAIKQDSRVKIQSETSLEAQNNREASVRIVDEIPILKSTIEGGSGTSRDVIQNIERVEVGVKLRLTPHIIPDRLVQMDLNPSIEAIIDTGSSSSEYTPTIARREVQTTVTVPDARTIVIAGLTREDKQEVVKKVPILGSIPLLGWLFRDTATAEEKRNILIFVTPRIVHSVADSEAVAAEWREKTGIKPDE